MEAFRLTHQKNACTIEALGLPVGADLVVSLWGGSVPHVGAVALAIPRPSLSDPARMSATSSVLTSPGHKEDDIVKPFAEKLAAALACTVSVSAGMHWELLPAGEIETVHLLCEELAQQVIDAIRNQRT